MKRKKITLTWSPALIEQAFAYADAHGISLSDLSESAVKAELERLDPANYTYEDPDAAQSKHLASLPDNTQKIQNHA
jgi:hypothetical protein